MEVRLVTGTGEETYTVDSLEAPTDEQLLLVMERRTEKDLSNYTITRNNGNVLISPTPVYG